MTYLLNSRRTIEHLCFVMCLFAILSILPNLVFAQTSVLNQGITVITIPYTHPQKRFSLRYPNDAVLTERKSPVDISLNSRLGWGMTVQSAQTNPSASLEQLAARLEAKYLGADKPWSRKLEGTRQMFKGYNAYQSLYEGSGMRARVLIIRTTIHDLVLMFVTPSESYAQLSSVYENILQTFQPAIEGAIQAPQEQQQSPDVSTPHISSDNVGYTQFQSPELGYSMLYPDHWRATKSDDFTVVFAAPTADLTTYLSITIQNVMSPFIASQKQMADAVLQQLKAQMAYGFSEVQHVAGGKVIISGIESMQLVSDYKRAKKPYRQWSIIVPRPTGNVVHVWTYTAPLENFNDYQSITEKMAGSFTIEQVTQ